jgi:hypothetical protein
MAVRMANGPYKKMLIRIPADILEALQEESRQSDRSVNGELVHILREGLTQRDLLPPERPRRQAYERVGSD